MSHLTKITSLSFLKTSWIFGASSSPFTLLSFVPNRTNMWSQTMMSLSRTGNQLTLSLRVLFKNLRSFSVASAAAVVSAPLLAPNSVLPLCRSLFPVPLLCLILKKDSFRSAFPYPLRPILDQFDFISLFSEPSWEVV